MDAQNDGVNQGPSEDWLCFICFKTVSAKRPPTLNLDNCSCSESGTSLNDPGALDLRLRNTPNEADGDHPMDPSALPRSEANGAPLTNCPSSSPSLASDLSSDNEGPPSDVSATGLLYKSLSMTIANLSIHTNVGNERYRLTGSPRKTNTHTHVCADAEMPYSLRRYVATMSRLERSFHLLGAPDGDREDKERTRDIYLIGLGTESMCAVNGMGSSIESSTHSSYGLMSWGMVDPVAGTGGWAEAVEGCEMALRATDQPLVIDDSAFLDE